MDTVMFLQLIALAVFAVAALILGGQISERMRNDYDALEDVALDSEIARKVAIADAAIEARRRGERFTPPADYDR